MKLKNLKEASYHGRSGAVVVRAFDPDGGDHLGTIGPMSLAQANKFIKAAEAHFKKQYKGRVNTYDMPIYDTEELITEEDFRQNIADHLDVFAEEDVF